MLTREEILKKLGEENSDKAAQDETLQKLADTVRTRIMFKLSEKLSDEDLAEIEKIIDSDKPDEQKTKEIDDYVSSHVDNYQSWAEKIEEDTINELSNNRQAIEEEVQAKLHSTPPTD